MDNDRRDMPRAGDPVRRLGIRTWGEIYKVPRGVDVGGREDNSAVRRASRQKVWPDSFSQSSGLDEDRGNRHNFRCGAKFRGPERNPTHRQGR